MVNLLWLAAMGVVRDAMRAFFAERLQRRIPCVREGHRYLRRHPTLWISTPNEVPSPRAPFLSPEPTLQCHSNLGLLPSS